MSDCLFLSLSLSVCLTRSQYKKPLPTGSVLLRCWHVLRAAVRNNKRRRERNIPPPPAILPARTPHWIDGAIDDYSAEEVKMVKSLWRVLPVFAVLPAFWTLFDQQASCAWSGCEVCVERGWCVGVCLCLYKSASFPVCVSVMDSVHVCAHIRPSQRRRI